jgi:hypothetical protein
MSVEPMVHVPPLTEPEPVVDEKPGYNQLAVLVPTRSRPHNVFPIIEAWGVTGAFAVADLIFIVDADDPTLPDYNAAWAPFVQVQRVIALEWQPLVPKLNRVAVQAAKEYGAVAFMGDDHIPRTNGWAQRLVENHRLKYNARIVYGRDGIQDEMLPTWWSMDSAIIKTLGVMVPSEVQHLYCDNAVKVLGTKVGCLYYDDQILIEHMHPIAGKAKMDAQYERVNRMQQYERDEVAFRAWLADGLARDARMLADI